MAIRSLECDNVALRYTHFPPVLRKARWGKPDDREITLTGIAAMMFGDAMESGGAVKINRTVYEVKSCAIDISSGEHHFHLRRGQV